MRKASMIVLGLVLAGPGDCRGQFGGGAAFEPGGGRSAAEQQERAKRELGEFDLPPTGDSMFVDANVLMNVEADEYVAVFGIVREGDTVAECNRAMSETVEEFTGSLEELGIDEEDRFVDFVMQNPIYEFEVTDDLAREVRAGFELKKNVSIRFGDPAMLDRLLVAAAESEIYDLIKVDYIVEDPAGRREELVEAAARVIDRKKARYGRLLGIRFEPPAQVIAERPSTYYPAEMYDSYTAFESERIANTSIRQRYAVQSARKTRTFYYNGLDPDGFDEVINPVTLAPAVQFTLYLKVRYEIEAAGD